MYGKRARRIKCLIKGILVLLIFFWGDWGRWCSVIRLYRNFCMYVCEYWKFTYKIILKLLFIKICSKSRYNVKHSNGIYARVRSNLLSLILFGTRMSPPYYKKGTIKIYVLLYKQ